MNTKVNEGKLISGKEALIALANGEEVEFLKPSFGEWELIHGLPINVVLEDSFNFRLKPRTITVNGIEVPAPFEPKEGEKYWCFSTYTVLGYGHNVYKSERADGRFINMGAWRTEEEIKQVISALRFVLNGGWHEH